MKEGFNIIEEVTLPADFQSLVDVENLVEKVCQTVGIQEDAFGNVLIAVTEAVNNAISHGNEQVPSLSIDVAVGDSIDSFCFKIKDQGLGFDYNNLPDPTAPENILKEKPYNINQAMEQNNKTLIDTILLYKMKKQNNILCHHFI
jgi:serine/threonine-protein kinase RsbW